MPQYLGLIKQILAQTPVRWTRDAAVNRFVRQRPELIDAVALQDGETVFHGILVGDFDEHLESAGVCFGDHVLRSLAFAVPDGDQGVGVFGHLAVADWTGFGSE